MTTPIKGKDGYIKIAGTTVAKITSVDFGPNFDVIDTTGIDQDEHTEVKGLRNEECSIAGYYVAADAQHVILKNAGRSETTTVSGIVVYLDASNYHTFPDTTLVKDWKETYDPSSVVSFTCVLVPNGTVTDTVES